MIKGLLCSWDRNAPWLDMLWGCNFLMIAMFRELQCSGDCNAIEIAMFRVFQCSWAHNVLEIAMFQVVIVMCLQCSWNLHAHGNCNVR
jgi:hypothetical protein